MDWDSWESDETDSVPFFEVVCKIPVSILQLKSYLFIYLKLNAIRLTVGSVNCLGLSKGSLVQKPWPRPPSLPGPQTSSYIPDSADIKKDN